MGFYMGRARIAFLYFVSAFLFIVILIYNWKLFDLDHGLLLLRNKFKCLNERNLISISQFDWSIQDPCNDQNANVTTDLHNNKFVSYCSCKADRRGLNQNVIAYSLYGNLSNHDTFTRYVDPIKMIIANISQFYPGWIMRVYSALEPGNQLVNLKLKEVFDEYPFVDLCNVSRVIEVHSITRPLFPMTWRFLPLMDPTVDRMLSRDIDSIILAREVDAVRQWLTESNTTFHIMRDHWGHCYPKILGGMWGAKIYQNRQVILIASSKLFYETEHTMQYGYDQAMLNACIWPLAINDSLAHDSYCCERYNGTTAFPTQRQGTEYVGKVVHQELVGHPPPKKCPAKCRPTQHPEWTKC